MIVDTHNKETLQKSICDYFHLSENELYCLFDSFYNSSRELEEAIEEYIATNILTPLDGVQFYHLSRRLNGSNLKMGNNLYDLLLNKSIISDFLSYYGIAFKKEADHLQLYCNGKLEELKYSSHGNVDYLKWRMGYIQDDEDYCFNGFALRDLLQHNTSYYNQLGFCPEFICQLAQVIDKESIIWDYRENSKYYCLEYLLPIDMVIIDGKEYLKSSKGKTEVLLSAFMLRLYNYWFDSGYSFDHDNVILRLSDTDTMEERYFVRAEELD